jgi:large subunit ribosomal protein L17
MSRHRRKTKHFSRKTNPRKGLIRGLVTALVEHGRIKTTVAKAKELRRHVERAVTLGKKGGLNTRRILLATYPNKSIVETLMTDLAARFKDTPGGYTRVLKLNNRPGDCAPQAFIEFIDYDKKSYAEKKVTIKVPDKDRKLVKKELTKTEIIARNVKKNAEVAFDRNKRVKKLAREARRVLRSHLA